MAKFILSCDDGCRSDVQVANLAAKYEIPCTFYWPVEWHSLAYEKGYLPLDYAQALDIASEHEIGSHTITHRHLTRISEDDAMKEIIGSKFALEKMFNQPINKFCPPRGYTSKSLTELTLKFYKAQRLTKGEGLVHVHPNSGANKNMKWQNYAKSIDVKELWFHSWELDKYNLWKELEDYLREATSG